MAIETYVGIDAPCISVENAEELYEALDLLHTQIMDTCCDDALLRILSDAMDRVQVVVDVQSRIFYEPPACEYCGMVHEPHANSLCSH